MNVEDYFTIGYMDYPATTHKPQPGTSAELHWSSGWIRAQKEEQTNTDLGAQLNFDMDMGRDSYAAAYR
jgi:hypothetical protein